MKNEYINVSWWFELPTKEETNFIKLFEEYLLKYNSEHWPINCSINIPWITLMWIHESVIISKQFWFIERLVEQNKINWRKKTELYYNISCYDWDWWEYELMWPNFTDTEQLIMILSIQDNPIEYLCSILKE